MEDQPTITAVLPTKTLLIYLVGWIFFCLLISSLYIININWETISSVHTMLDLFSAGLFVVFALFGLLRLTKKLELYNDRIVRKNILGRKVTFFKDVNGHFIDDSDNNTLAYAKGYFRGIIIKKKDGKHFSLNKAELTEFAAVKKHLRTRCRYFNNQAIKRQIRKEDQKIFLFLIIVILILIASLMH